MRIITHKTIADFTKTHPEAKIALNDWYIKTEKSEWLCFSDIKKSFGSIDAIGNKRYVFNIKGGSYRLITIILFEPQIVYIRFIGTHSEYDKIKDCSKI